MNHVLLGAFRRLADGFRHFVGLTQTVSDSTFTVSDDHQAAEAETAATLDNLGDAIEVDDFSINPLSFCSIVLS